MSTENGSQAGLAPCPWRLQSRRAPQPAGPPAADPPLKQVWQPPERPRSWVWAWWALALGLAAVAIAGLLLMPRPADSVETVSVALGAGQRLVFVRVPAGDFAMGASDAGQEVYEGEGPAHAVYLDEYLIGRYEVTVAQYRAFVAATGYVTSAELQGWAYAWTGKEWEPVSDATWRRPRGPHEDAAPDDHPVTQVSWDDAVAFCLWASAVTGLDVRLPTEAQFERAARGDDGRMWPWGTVRSRQVANYADRNLPVSWADQRRNDHYRFTAPVGTYPAGASPYGALDMAGNVSEWVLDWYDSGYYAVSPYANPSGPVTGTLRVLRGGSWSACVRVLWTTARMYADPGLSYDSGGFRVAAVSAAAVP